MSFIISSAQIPIFPVRARQCRDSQENELEILYLEVQQQSVVMMRMQPK